MEFENSNSESFEHGILRFPSKTSEVSSIETSKAWDKESLAFKDKLYQSQDYVPWKLHNVNIKG